MYTYDSFHDMIRLRDLFDSFFRDVPASTHRREFPYINLFEKDDTLEITALLPGVKPEDVHVELIENALVISGERKSDKEEKPAIRNERTFGTFQKSVKLPYQVNRNDVRAELKNGILRIHLSKSEEVRPKKISIN